jgi:hypothetical protein
MMKSLGVRGDLDVEGGRYQICCHGSSYRLRGVGVVPRDAAAGLPDPSTVCLLYSEMASRLDPSKVSPLGSDSAHHHYGRHAQTCCSVVESMPYHLCS